MADKQICPAPEPGCDSFQYLENLSCAYWYSQTFFTALEVGLFGFLEPTGMALAHLAKEAACRPDELGRLMAVLEKMGLVVSRDGVWYNSQVASLFLVPGKPDFMGEFFLYRKYMRPNWEKLTLKVTGREKKPEPPLSYKHKNLKYVKAMDTLARQKAGQIVDAVGSFELSGPILDVGGGAAGLIREFQKKYSHLEGVVFDLPEVIRDAQRLFPDPEDWEKIVPIAGDFRIHSFKNDFGLIILSNFLHIYGPEEAREMLLKAVSLLDKKGLLLVHDYFPDREGCAPQKGALYDLCMMLNTYNGACHTSGIIMGWLKESGLHHFRVTDLETDSSVIIAGSNPDISSEREP